MKRLLIGLITSALCAAASVTALADGVQRSYSADGGNLVVLTVFVAVCALALAVLVIGYRHRRKKLLAKLKQTALQAQPTPRESSQQQ